MNGPTIALGCIVAVVIGAIIAGLWLIGRFEDKAAAKKAAEDAAGEAEYARKFGPRLVPPSAPVRPVAPAGGEVVSERPEPVDFTADPHAP